MSTILVFDMVENAYPVVKLIKNELLSSNSAESKLALLYLLSDMLFNCGNAPNSHLIVFKQHIEGHVPEILSHFNKIVEFIYN